MFFLFNSIKYPDRIRELSEEAVRILRSGGIIAAPTDTLYGFLGTVRSEAIERLHQIKGRAENRPFLFLLAEDFPWQTLVDPLWLKDHETRIEPFLSANWPGRVTCVFPKNPSLEYPPGNTVAIRIPSQQDNFFLHLVLREIREPLAAPSLNFTGEEPLREKDEIRRRMERLVDGIFYDEAFFPSSSSQVWDVTLDPFHRLR